MDSYSVYFINSIEDSIGISILHEIIERVAFGLRVLFKGNMVTSKKQMSIV